MSEQEQVTIPGVEVKKERKTYPKLKSVEDVPVSRSQLSHDWMVDYTLAKGTPEQAAALLEFEEKHQVTKSSHLKTCQGVQYTVTDIKPMRNLFCDWFFPELKETKSKPKNKESQLERSRRLLAEKAAQAKKAPAASKSKK